MGHDNEPAESLRPASRRRTNLTERQLLIWTSQQLYPEVPLYNMLMLWNLSGEVNPEIFQQAYQAVVDGSDALRTVIDEVDGLPRQRVLQRSTGAMEYLDLSRAPDPEDALYSWLRERCRKKPLDLATCLSNSALLKLSDRKYAWALNQHHIITDQWTKFLILRLTMEQYQRISKGHPPQPPALPAFADFITHELRQRQSDTGREAARYWQRKLVERAEPIPFHSAETSASSLVGERITRALALTRSRALRELAAAHGDSNFATFATFASTPVSRRSASPSTASAA